MLNPKEKRRWFSAEGPVSLKVPLVLFGRCWRTLQDPSLKVRSVQFPGVAGGCLWPPEPEGSARTVSGCWWRMLQPPGPEGSARPASGRCCRMLQPPEPEGSARPVAGCWWRMPLAPSLKARLLPFPAVVRPRFWPMFQSPSLNARPVRSPAVVDPRLWKTLQRREA